MSTTTERRAESKDIIFALNTCIETNIDGEKGLSAAAADARAPELKDYLLLRAEERAGFVRELQSAIQQLDAFAENQGTARGIVHRGFTDIRLALEGHKDNVVVQEWIRGEKAALTGYERALRHAPLDTLPIQLRAMIQRQHAAIQTALGDAYAALARVS
ncbi:MAG: PA2169 family four-helix-bundle protein [Polyangiaceae bacterium]